MDGLGPESLSWTMRKDICLTLRQVLKDLGLTADTGDDGTEALSRIAKKVYDFMLLDLRMPGLGSLETLEGARRQAPELPIIIMTVQGTVKRHRQNAVHAIQRGAVDVLSPSAPTPCAA